jgi:hypothetical protein
MMKRQLDRSQSSQVRKVAGLLAQALKAKSKGSLDQVLENLRTTFLVQDVSGRERAQINVLNSTDSDS